MLIIHDVCDWLLKYIGTNRPILACLWFPITSFINEQRFASSFVRFSFEPNRFVGREFFTYQCEQGLKISFRIIKGISFTFFLRFIGLSFPHSSDRSLLLFQTKFFRVGLVPLTVFHQTLVGPIRLNRIKLLVWN